MVDSIVVVCVVVKIVVVCPGFLFVNVLLPWQDPNNVSCSSEQLLITRYTCVPGICKMTCRAINWEDSFAKKKEKRTTITATKRSREMRRAAFCWLILMTIDFHWKCDCETNEQIVKCFVWWAKSVWCSVQDWSHCTLEWSRHSFTRL